MDSITLTRFYSENIGTVHKFQGREANEVIFVLGCDESIKSGYAVTGFVNSNIVNVAVTRAKYRLYIVGDYRVWRNNSYVSTAKHVMDTLPLKRIAEASNDVDSEERVSTIQKMAAQLPGSSSFVTCHTDSKVELEYDVDSAPFIEAVDEGGFLRRDLSEKQYEKFGFKPRSDFDKLPYDVKKNLLMGMKLYYLLEPAFKDAPDLDASCCGILFCKGMELYLRTNFVNGLKSMFPEYLMKTPSGREIPLRNAKDSDFTFGAIRHVLQSHVNDLAGCGDSKLTASWWKAFCNKLDRFAKIRNKCCHPDRFAWKDLKLLLTLEFRVDKVVDEGALKIDGLFYESAIGKSINP